ncbi:glutathione S-transferase family protein [Pacificibacter marinus]|uniref:glutathione S-transferase family protein n=1 Tax=Pacificibacter marinus TaxID=658057 RepID=UPI001C072760|nr:glutathione S-transferase family protein [Pacificibacter marinus]MBU2865726.1 glutathione S-transferase family protein [Pacificibacter marinus]
MLTLYHGSTSVCSQKVRVGLAELGLSYDSVVLDLQRGDQFDPDYRKLNPSAVVPTLVDDGLVVVESSLILDYLDRKMGAGQLSPKGDVAEVTTAHWMLRTLDIHAAINTLSFSTVARDRIRAKKTSEQIAQDLERMPDPVSRLKRLSLLEGGLDSVHVTQALLILHRAFTDMQAALEAHDWMMGAAFSKVDVALIAYVDRLDRLGFSGLWLTEFPAIDGWLRAMQSRQSYATGIAAFADPVASETLRQSGAHYWLDLEERWLKLP